MMGLLNVDSSTPQLINKSYDPALDGCLFFLLESGKGPLEIGSDERCQIQMPGLEPSMAFVNNQENGSLTIRHEAGRVLLNGRQIGSAEEPMHHGDWLRISYSVVFLVHCPEEAQDNQNSRVKMRRATMMSIQDMEEATEVDDEAYRQFQAHLQVLESSTEIGHFRARVLNRKFKKLLRNISKANAITQLLAPRSRYEWVAELLTDPRAPGGMPECIVRLKKYETGVARWRHVVRHKAMRSKGSKMDSALRLLLEPFTRVALTDGGDGTQTVAEPFRTVALFETEAFEERLQHLQRLQGGLERGEPVDAAAGGGPFSELGPSDVGEVLRREKQLQQELARARQDRGGVERLRRQAAAPQPGGGRLGVLAEASEARLRRQPGGPGGYDPADGSGLQAESFSRDAHLNSLQQQVDAAFSHALAADAQESPGPCSATSSASRPARPRSSRPAASCTTRRAPRCARRWTACARSCGMRRRAGPGRAGRAARELPGRTGAGGVLPREPPLAGERRGRRQPRRRRRAQARWPIARPGAGLARRRHAADRRAETQPGRRPRWRRAEARGRPVAVGRPGAGLARGRGRASCRAEARPCEQPRRLRAGAGRRPEARGGPRPRLARERAWGRVDCRSAPVAYDASAEHSWLTGRGGEILLTAFQTELHYMIYKNGTKCLYLNFNVRDEEEDDDEELDAEIKKLVEQSPPPAELTDEERKQFFRKPKQSDILAATLSSAFTTFTLPEKEEGFDDVKYEWYSKTKSAAYLKNWVLNLKLTLRVEDLQPGEWFTKQWSSWQQQLQQWHAKKTEFELAKKNEREAKRRKILEEKAAAEKKEEEKKDAEMKDAEAKEGEAKEGEEAKEAEKKDEPAEEKEEKKAADEPENDGEEMMSWTSSGWRTS
ncbi:unnamed protein product [Prorocentrum cordatum]|uniref:FHA domain-containing protein n=1 Tax=Prorocentrum cordatum TaxID=2364126 RepID=A0ABN9Y005_9DINO|nr:unnamed protein product [Polarella glacialis]